MHHSGLIGPSLSIAPPLVICTLYLCVPASRILSVRALLYTALADLTRSIAGVFITLFHHESCTWLFGLRQFAVLASLTWSAVYLLVTLHSLRRSTFTIWRLELLFHCICWGVPALSVVVSLGAHSLGAAAECWMFEKYDMYESPAEYIPVLLLKLVELGLAGLCACALRGRWRSVLAATRAPCYRHTRWGAVVTPRFSATVPCLSITTQ